ncbi:hypothetical protein CAAN1_03S04566 [[Candida] anglica]|uniref:Gag1-like clamp domain-containing protein n=1 Tax=[Candida] anglica TaxID=148631 RepID=A0ABP0EIA4_9ASCO
MNAVTSSATYNDRYTPPPKTIIRNTKSTSNLRSKTKSKSQKNQVKKHSKVGTFLHKLTSGCSLFFLRLRALSDEVFSHDEVLREIFVDSGDEDELDPLTFMDRHAKSNKGLNKAEEKFLADFTKEKSLENMYIKHQLAINNVTERRKVQAPVLPSLQDVLRQQSQSDITSSTQDSSEIPFDVVDVHKMKKEFDLESNTLENFGDEITLPAPTNIGDVLWRYRREKWLQTNLSQQQIEQRVNESAIDFIPREAYAKVYTHLIDKGKVLKDDRRLNLKDLIEVINAGWVAEEKWERAANGLA